MDGSLGPAAAHLRGAVLLHRVRHRPTRGAPGLAKRDARPGSRAGRLSACPRVGGDAPAAHTLRSRGRQAGLRQRNHRGTCGTRRNGAPEALPVTSSAIEALPSMLLNMEAFRHLYVHVPFCRHKCGYCDFNAYARLDGLMQPYVEALERELGYAAERYPFGPLATVYFGGGTPSLMPAESIRRLLDRIRSLFGIQGEAEITLEANPTSTDPAQLET